jgi:GTPase
VNAPFRSGYVALVGRPNVGKSTLLNQLVGQKIAATTHKPQTTRRKMLGILHPPGAQILLLDTPGYHQAKGPLNRFMVAEARAALKDADVIGYIVEAREDGAVTPGNERLIAELVRANKPVVLIVNKIDRLKDKELLLPFLDTYRRALGDLLREAVPISALKGKGLDPLLKAITANLPEGPQYYEEGQLTNEPERAIVAELVREKVMLETKDELPYAVAVTVESFEDQRPKIVRIAATIHVERDSQKGIIIGRGGERLKQIGTRARKDIEFFVGSKVFLQLHVRVAEKWSTDPRALAELGYTPGADLGPEEPEELEAFEPLEDAPEEE